MRICEKSAGDGFQFISCQVAGQPAAKHAIVFLLQHLDFSFLVITESRISRLKTVHLCINALKQFVSDFAV